METINEVQSEDSKPEAVNTTAETSSHQENTVAVNEATANEPTEETLETPSNEALDTKKDSVVNNDSESTTTAPPIAKEEAIPTVDPIAEELNQLKYSELGKTELIKALKKLDTVSDIKEIDPILKKIKERFDRLFASERAGALKDFQEEGNSAKDFEYKNSEEDSTIFNEISRLRKKKIDYFAALEQQKESNLKKKRALIEDLRLLVEGEESSASMDSLKKIREAWRSIGPVPSQHNSELWASFNALIDRFYNYRSIHFELKELDRKKNLAQKMQLCEKVEALEQVESVPEAVKLLNDYHDEFKHIGPVPKEVQEATWERFKTASDKVYERRKAYYEEQKLASEQNLVKKKEIIEKVKPYLEFNSDRIKEWNTKTKEVQAIQKEWEAIGFVPKEVAQEINKKFWDSLKQFFKNKSDFFKELDKERSQNLEKKKELVAEAEKIRENEDFNKTADQFKALQAKWKEIGPVPDKFRESIYAEFRVHCDHFFNRRRDQRNEQEKEFVQNFEDKKAVCAAIEQLAEGELSLDKAVELMEKHAAIGFVPRSNIKEARILFENATAKLLKAEGLSNEDKDELNVRIQMSKYQNSPDGKQRVDRLVQTLRNKISAIENDIANMDNNLSYFARSSNFAKLKAEFDEKKVVGNKEIKSLRQQIKLVRGLS